MPDTKTCPKCNGQIKLGALQQIGNYGNLPFVWAPESEPSFQVKGATSPRKNLTVFAVKTAVTLNIKLSN